MPTIQSLRPNALTRKRTRTRRPSTRQYLELSRDARLDVRASQRTFEGAYIRTALGQLSFSLVVLKLFSKDFIPIGTLFTVYSILVIFFALYRRSQSKAVLHNEENNDHMFETSGRTVVILSFITAVSYAILLWLLIRIDM